MVAICSPLCAQDSATPSQPNASATSSQNQQSAEEQNNQEKPLSPAEKNLQLLYKKNPFGESTATATEQQQQGASTTMVSPQGLELRSIYKVNNTWFFSVRDTTQDKSYTLKLGEAYTDSIPFAVEFFDDETNSVSITSPLGSYTLTLKERDELTGKPVVGSSAKKSTKTLKNSKTNTKR